MGLVPSFTRSCCTSNAILHFLTGSMDFVSCHPSYRHSIMSPFVSSHHPLLQSCVHNLCAKGPELLQFTFISSTFISSSYGLELLYKAWNSSFSRTTCRDAANRALQKPIPFRMSLQSKVQLWFRERNQVCTLVCLSVHIGCGQRNLIFTGSASAWNEEQSK